MLTRGTHLLVECRGCDAARLNDAVGLEAALRAAAARMDANVVTAAFHRFAPQGVTGMLLLEESHISIHTWPEHGYAAIDLYTCGERDVELAMPVLRAALLAERVDQLRVERGCLSESDQPALHVVASPAPGSARGAS
ncbi:MAG: S-adenosylmethionine decarboxylase proenzyme [Myxococcaceae bacterium]|nr:S-adenosylmethionine decarboxylase proenzyme [Myxococcaceae bacterium]